MFTNFKSKTSKIMAFILAACMLLSMIPVSLITVFAATTNHPDAVTITVIDEVTGEPVKNANVNFSIYDIDVGDDVSGDEFAKTDENGEVVVWEGDFGNIKISSLIVSHDDYATYTNMTYDQTITSLDDNFVVELTCIKIKDVTVTANDLTYTGEAQSAVSVNGLKQDDVVTYTVNGEPSTDGKVTEAGDYSVVVKVERENFDALVVSVDVTVKQAVLNFDIAPVTGLKYNGQEQVLVTLTGSFATGDTVTWTVNGEETNSSEVPKADAIGNYKVKLTVVRNDNYKTFEKEVDVAIDTGVLNIENLEVKANDRTYDGSTKDALTVKNQGDYNLEYKLGENGTWTTDTIPQITDAGTYKVYVKATKTGYHDAEYPTYPITVTIAQAKITGVTATGYSAKYDKQSHDAITKVDGTLDSDTVTYSKTEDGTYTLEIPSVKNVKDSGTYYVKVYRNDNYETLIIPVTVSVGLQAQTIAFGAIPKKITYNDNNTFTYAIETKSADDSTGDITYSLVGGTAQTSIDSSTGTITYNSVGTVKVKATIAQCKNYLSAEIEYEVEIVYAAYPNSISITPSDAVVDNCKWYKGDVVINADSWEIIKDSNALGQTSWAQEIVESAEKDYPNYKVAFKDAAGNITDLYDIPYFAIDKTAPALIPNDVNNDKYGVKFELTCDDPVSEIIHFLSFGLFCKKEIKVTVNCSDAAQTAGSPNSGIASIQLFKYDMNGNSTPVDPDDDNVPNVFTLPVGFEGTVKVKITDEVGNILDEQLITDSNSNMKDVNGYVMIEDVAPVVSDITHKNINGDKAPNGKQYASDIRVTFDAQDVGAGLYSVTVTVNDVDYTDRIASADSPTTFAAQDRNPYEYSFTTENIEPNDDGEYNFVVKVVDNAGNTSEKKLTVEKDLTSPIITGFDFGKDVEEYVSIEDYGYYFKEGVTVTVSADDKKANDAHELISGVKGITVVLVDKDGKYYTVNTEGKIIAITNATEAISRPVTNNTVAFTMIDDFKGQIYAFATDNVGNNPSTAINKFDVTPDDVVSEKDSDLFGYKRPNGSVLESPVLHTTTSSIIITANEKTSVQNESYVFQYSGAGQKDKEMSYDDSQKVPLYNYNPTFTLKVTDTYSGIRSIKTTVFENGTETVDVIDISNKAEKSGTAADEWTIKNEDDDSNLIYYAERAYKVNGNFNNMVILVELTDRAGNTSYDYYTFGIDKTAPVITVEMNDNDDEKYDGFFKEDRTYKVTILERNFIKNVKFVVTVTDDNDVKSDVNITPDFKVVMDGDKPKSTIKDGIEYYTYEWDSKFTADGDYTFSVSAIDLADNETVDDKVSYVNGDQEPVNIRTISNEFTVDQTDPIISVSYDNNTAQNDKYFAKARIATIVIKEHNFDVERVDFSALTASLDKNEIAKPEIKWEHHGNTHTATISFAVDGDYTFDVKMTDKASNESKAADYGNSVAGKEFVVDLTAPKLDITGVADKSANNGEVAPVITYSDVNFNKDAVSIVLSGINNGKVDYNGKYTDAEHGQTYTYANFEKIQKVDDIYTLTAKLIDMAGNETEKTITFSANRFGSVYDLTNVKDIISKYLQNEKDIVFTETNVDSLEREGIKIKLTKNGTPTDLVEGTDYTVDVTGGNGQWSVYKYTVNKKLFTDDGRYSISIYSKDAAGNVNENIDETKEAEISFGIDKTKPVIVPIDFESDVQYAVDVKTVSVEIKDNLVLETVKIYLNGEEIEYKVDGETYTFDIPKSNSKQDVKIVAVDAAGNEQPVEVNDFLVNTNIFVRWYNNTPLFIGSIIGVVLLALGLTIFLVFFKKKKEA